MTLGRQTLETDFVKENKAGWNSSCMATNFFPQNEYQVMSS